jgi:hypothetical protein
MRSLFPSDDDWKDRALAMNQLVPPTFDAAGVQSLNCDRWVAASLLQKAIRRGETQLALAAAFTLHQFDRSRTWRRLLVIAFEDIGAADSEAITETAAIGTSPSWRSRHGEKESLAHTVCRLATAPKDRSADYLISTAEYHPLLAGERERGRSRDIEGRLITARQASEPLPSRALAISLSSGIEPCHGTRWGGGDLTCVLRLFLQLGVPDDLARSTVLAAKRTRGTFALMVPLIWLEARKSRGDRFSSDIIPEVSVVDGIPTYAFDKHTRLGLRAFQVLLKESTQLRACLDQFVPKQNWRDATQMAAFYTDAYVVSRRLDWSMSQSLIHGAGLSSQSELDGDQAAAPGCIILPGDDAPERVVFEQLQQAQWPEVPQRIGRSPAESIDALNAAMTLADHHEWIKAAADRLTVGGDILWQAMSASWASNCATPEQLLAVAQPVSDALEGL